MKIKVPAIAIMLFALCMACNNERSVKAKIFERKRADSNQIIIKYRYTVDERPFIDSATLTNTVIAGDSINITIDPSKPQTSKFNPSQ